MRTLKEISAVILENMQATRETYAGLTLEEITAHNRKLMFGVEFKNYKAMKAHGFGPGRGRTTKLVCKCGCGEVLVECVGVCTKKDLIRSYVG